MRNLNNLIHLIYGPHNNLTNSKDKKDHMVNNDTASSTLTILSWNIEGAGSKSSGNKFSNGEFLKIFDSVDPDVICLQETKSIISNQAKYTAYNKNRTDDKVGGKSGGVCTLVRKTLDDTIKIHPTCNHDIVHIELKQGKHQPSTHIINAYISPSNSSYVNHRTDYDPFGELNSILCKIDSSESTILMGDFNARTAKVDEIVSRGSLDEILNLPNHLSSHVDEDIPKRNNTDPATNANAESLIDILKSHDLLILNGRTTDDMHGAITCIKYNGSSTIDYAITRTKSFKMCKSLVVKDLTQFSDHRPLVSKWFRPATKAKSTSEPSKTMETMIREASSAFIWKQDSSKDFHEALAEMSQEVNDISKGLDQHQITVESLTEACDKLTNVFIKAANETLDRKKKRADHGGVRPWFNSTCKSLKMRMDKLLRKVNNNPCKRDVREKYYAAKKAYKRYKNFRKRSHNDNLTRKIEESGQINWKAFDKLKASKKNSDEEQLDEQQFFLYFKNLYSKDVEIDSFRREFIDEEAEKLINSKIFPGSVFTVDDLEGVLKQTKNGKAPGSDEVTNEMIKQSTASIKLCLISIFNACLSEGIFPWKQSTIVPLHKKGPKEDPDNYRPISLSSCIGKILSKLILKKLQLQRDMIEPECQNQRGFSPGAMTIDHVFTLQTIVKKHKSTRECVFGAFIDFRKAFDTIWRKALILKLKQYGFEGKLVNLIEDYYKERSACLKIGNNITDDFETVAGVIQGEPPSPDLFKIFIADLSKAFDEEAIDSPNLNGTMVSHLFWADDLYLNSLSEAGLQKLLNILEEYCIDWGLIPNPAKCNIMIFNQSAKEKDLRKPHRYTLGNEIIEVTDSYTYLGINITPNLDCKQALKTLADKGRRAMFALLNTINWKVLAVPLILKLFRALIEPILLYGCQLLIPQILPGQLLRLDNPNINNESYFSNHAMIKIEKVHLTFMKWILGINRKATNVFCWQESGELPLIFKAMDLSNKYFDRLENMDTESLAYKALLVQKQLNLKWFSVLHDDIRDVSNIIKMKKHFIEMTASYCRSHSKMEVVTNTGTKFGLQLYLQHIKDFVTRQSITKLRGSCHCLEIEVGRYTKKERQDRICVYCNEISKIMVEDEVHLLGLCTLTTSVRSKYSIPDGSNLLSMLAESNSTSEHHRLGTIIQAMYEIRQNAKKPNK